DHGLPVLYDCPIPAGHFKKIVVYSLSDFLSGTFIAAGTHPVKQEKRFHDSFTIQTRDRHNR
ncbi:MAG: hypothetical protein Q7U03_00290, partial [Syntrophales bacterium]|nr:hypothetical protein [Syntrophales bacterium]